MKQIGIVGGLGPETGCMFYMQVNNKIIARTNIQPNIIMENVPMSESTLKKLANGNKPKEVLELLKKSIIKLNSIGSDLIAIPCNTVHVFIEQLREISEAPIISIIEESADECERRNAKKVAIIASTTSVKDKLHINELEKRCIDYIIPTRKQQKSISEIIVKIITNRVTDDDRNELISIIDDTINKGADTIMLACTDLRTIINNEDINAPIIETTATLENAITRKILE